MDSHSFRVTNSKITQFTKYIQEKSSRRNLRMKGQLVTFSFLLLLYHEVIAQKTKMCYMSLLGRIALFFSPITFLDNISKRSPKRVGKSRCIFQDETFCRKYILFENIFQKGLETKMAFIQETPDSKHIPNFCLLFIFKFALTMHFTDCLFFVPFFSASSGKNLPLENWWSRRSSDWR